MDQAIPQIRQSTNSQLTSNNFLIILLVILSSFILLGIGVLIGINLSNKTGVGEVRQENDLASQTTVVLPTPTIEVVPTTTPSPMPTAVPTKPKSTSTPTLTPQPTAVIDEVGLVRKLIANFENINATGNTAGSLDYFTPPVSADDKTKLAQIRSQNLPYSISSWRFGASDDRYLLNKKYENLYQVIMLETRNEKVTTLIVEVTRVNDNFLIDRYYEAGSQSPNLKYEGFKL